MKTADSIENNTVYEWILETFSVSGRAASVETMAPYLSSLVKEGDEVLDLCCGGGPASFWFASQGANVTGLDFAPYMITLARKESERQNSPVQFIEADIFTYGLEARHYNLISCFGNSISDFPIRDFVKLSKKVADALKPGGRFAVQYHDGSYRYIQGSVQRSGIYQESPERITYQFKEYLPEIGACVNTIRNEGRGLEYDRRAYVYSVPVVQVIAGAVLQLEQHIRLEENHYLDIFAQSSSR